MDGLLVHSEPLDRTTMTALLRGEPHPDTFLPAAARHSVGPEQSIVCGDAPAGVEAAVAAGTHVVAVPRGSTLHARFPVRPHTTFASLEEAIPWLAARGVGGVAR
jgi:beta-phosphoglucomutase-like phosphatase (HAD superfamily)